MSAYGQGQKRKRLQREVEHFARRLGALVDPRSPQQRRQRTIAARCLKRRVEALIKLDAKEAGVRAKATRTASASGGETEGVSGVGQIGEGGMR